MDLTERYGQIKRTKGNGSALYSYSITTNDFAEMWYKLHNDLGYPLKIDSRYKRAIIYNKQGLEKQIEEMIGNVIGENLEKISNLVMDDITNQLDSIMQNASGHMVKTRSSSLGSLLGKALGKGLVNGISKIVDDITNPKDRRYRR